MAEWLDSMYKHSKVEYRTKSCPLCHGCTLLDRLWTVKIVAVQPTRGYASILLLQLPVQACGLYQHHKYLARVRLARVMNHPIVKSVPLFFPSCNGILITCFFIPIIAISEVSCIRFFPSCNSILITSLPAFCAYRHIHPKDPSNSQTTSFCGKPNRISSKLGTLPDL